MSNATAQSDFKGPTSAIKYERCPTCGFATIYPKKKPRCETAPDPELAAEAADQLAESLQLTRQQQREVKSAIQAAIEKSYQQGRIDREREIYGLKDRAAHASERVPEQSSDNMSPAAHASEPFPKNREEMNATHKAQHDALVSEFGKPADASEQNRITPSLEAINTADRCCNWLQSDDDPIEHGDRMTCAKFIQPAIQKAYAEGVQDTKRLEIPLEVRMALRIILNHVEPSWDNCKTVVSQWLDATFAK